MHPRSLGSSSYSPVEPPTKSLFPNTRSELNHTPQSSTFFLSTYCVFFGTTILLCKTQNRWTPNSSTAPPEATDSANMSTLVYLQPVPTPPRNTSFGEGLENCVYMVCLLGKKEKYISIHPGFCHVRIAGRATSQAVAYPGFDSASTRDIARKLGVLLILGCRAGLEVGL